MNFKISLTTFLEVLKIKPTKNRKCSSLLPLFSLLSPKEKLLSKRKTSETPSLFPLYPSFSFWFSAPSFPEQSSPSFWLYVLSLLLEYPFFLEPSNMSLFAANFSSFNVTCAPFVDFCFYTKPNRWRFWFDWWGYVK